MRIVIYGAGAIGGVVGGYIGRAEQQVVLIGRQNNVRAINENGLKLVIPSGSHNVRIPAVTGPGEIDFTADDVIFLCVKGQNTEEALSDLKAVTDDVPIFCLQNGVRNESIATKYYPRVYGVMVRMFAAYLKDGEVTARREPPGWFVMGHYPSGSDDLVETVASDLHDAGILTTVTTEISHYKWGKLILNLGNVVRAITNTNGKIEDTIVDAVRKEAQTVLTQAGIGWVSGEQMSREWPGERPRSPGRAARSC